MGNSTMSMAIFLFFVCLPEANSHEIHHFWCWKSPTDTAPAPFGASAPASSRPPTRRGAGRLGEFTKNDGKKHGEIHGKMGKTWWKMMNYGSQCCWNHVESHGICSAMEWIHRNSIGEKYVDFSYKHVCGFAPAQSCEITRFFHGGDGCCPLPKKCVRWFSDLVGKALI